MAEGPSGRLQVSVLSVDEQTLAQRRAQWQPPAPRYTRGVMAKYAATVGCAASGAITDRF